jgi:glutamyl-tRNA synthetase
VDLAKFNDVSKNVISRMSAEQVVEFLVDWAKEFNPQYHEKLVCDIEFTKGIFSIDRGGNKPRKDIACWQEAPVYTEYFFEQPISYELPETMVAEDAATILERYVLDYNHDVDKDGWFANLKAICPELGYSPDVKAYKKDPTAFKGHVGDVSTAVRLAITGRRNTPDLYAIMQLLGKDECVNRIRNAVTFFRQ